MNRIKQVKPNNPNYYQGYYKPLNEDKYLGKPDEVIYRSSYERKFMEYCDKNHKILKWSSEPIGIPYISPIDNKTHTYYIDFWVKMLNANDNIETVLIEVKPKKQLEKPVWQMKYKKLAKIKSYNKSLEMYITNVAKFSAAREFAKKNNMKFLIITEDFLFYK